MKTVFLFPGQGAQYQGMARDLRDAGDKVKALFDFASEKTDMDLTKLLFEGSEEELKATDKTQIAVTLASLAASLYLKERGITPDGTAGFSLGEYPALYEAGVIAREDIFPLVKIRGELMEKASRNLDSDTGKSGMAAVIGLSYDEVVPVLDQLKGDAVYPANYSSPIQVVLAGTAEGLKKAEALFEEAGAMKYVHLNVSGPFHSPLLKEASDGLREALKDMRFGDPQIPVYANASGKRVQTGEEAKEMLVKQIISTVRWVDEEQAILDDGFEEYLEVGPGKVLSGLWKSFYKQKRCRPAGTVEAIEKLLEDR
jgi:[acyl-carrier-protein] S-malonyltransferase